MIFEFLSAFQMFFFYERELDPAMLRRLEKRILVPLPDLSARLAMLKQHLPDELRDLEDIGHTIKTSLDYENLAEVIINQPFTCG